jgi:XTP/dITP diphosphohydrolase
VKIIMVTSNADKAAEVAVFFRGLLEVDHVAFEIPEFRSDNVGEIAREKARFAYRQLKKPLIVDDTGFFIDALGGFPGSYASYVQNTIGNQGILTLMKEQANRIARFTTAISFADHSGIYLFTGTLEGKITFSCRGRDGFGYDPIFQVGEKTLAEMSIEEKSMISHRARALFAFRDWLFHEQNADVSHDKNG